DRARARRRQPRGFGVGRAGDRAAGRQRDRRRRQRGHLLRPARRRPRVRCGLPVEHRRDGGAAGRRGGAHLHHPPDGPPHRRRRGPAHGRVNTSPMATTLLTIGEFSRMTHLSVKALRHYHDMGVLEPAAIDPFTGYRSYDATQVVPAQVIRRLRDLGMPLDSIRSVLIAPDLETRNREIAAHLGRMERQLAQTQASVAGLRALLAGPVVRPAVEYRKIPAATALAVAQVVSAADLATWGSDALGALADALATSGVAPGGATGPFGALFPGDFFELERSEITAFVPVGSPPAGFELPGG